MPGINDNFGKMFFEMGLKNSLPTPMKPLSDMGGAIDGCEHCYPGSILPQIETVMSTMDEMEQEEKECKLKIIIRE